MTARQVRIGGLLIGVFFVSVYVLSVTVGVPLPERLVLALVFLIAPAAIVGVMAVRGWVGAAVNPPPLPVALVDVGTVFLIIAFALFDLMLIVQQTVRFHFRDLLAAAEAEAVTESLQLIYRGVNPVQLGIDITFDVFYCLGIVFVSAAMLGMGRVQKVTAWFGVLSALGLLALNLWTFPKPPAEAGLLDLGPVTAVWWVAVMIQMARGAQRSVPNETTA